MKQLRKDSNFRTESELIFIKPTLQGRKEFRQRIGVFDTGSWLRLPRIEIVRFYEGICLAAERYPDTLFLCKPKAPNVYDIVFAPDGEGGEQFWRRFSSMSNVVFLSSEEEDLPVIAVCDLVISICFTSACLAAWAAGGRAIYFSPTDLFSDVFWRKIPGAVVVGADALIRYLEDPSWETADAALGQRLALNGIVPSRDGKSLSRLREALLSSLSLSMATLNSEESEA